MSGSERDRREYQKRYYQERLKAKRQRRPMGLAVHTETGQLELFKWNQQNNQPLTMVEKSTTSQQVNHSSTRPQAQTQLSLVDFNQVSTNQPSVNQSATCQPSTMVDFSTVNTVNQMIDQVAQNIHQLALNRLFPSAKRRINFWVIGELLALIILSIVIVTVTTKAVATVDVSLWPLVALLEVVAMFFSLTLANHAGANFVARGIMLIVCVGLTNFLVAKATLNQGQAEIAEAKNRVAQAELLRAEIRREQLGITELEARGRITLAGERTKRLDQLRGELTQLQRATASVDQALVWLTVIIRVVLGFSVILINHQISKIIVERKFFILDIQNKERA